MNVLPELSVISAAKYGLHLKDPIYKAFDKLVQDSRFDLVQNPAEDDFAEFNDTLKEYTTSTTMCNTIRNILILIEILNGRKGYYTRKTTTPLEKEDTIFYWIDMLLKEFMNSGTGYPFENPTRGSGIVNGMKLRAAIYHILDILNCNSALYTEDVEDNVLPSPYYLMGRYISQVKVHGTESGVGYLNTTDGKYYVDVEIKDIIKTYDNVTTMTLLIGENPLGEGETVTWTISAPQLYLYSFYSITVKDFNCNVELRYKHTRDNELTPGAVKEKTGTPPLIFYTVDTSLLDWVINGAEGGVGKVGKNYLKPVTTPIPNGAPGTWLGSVSWQDASTGFTFNSGSATIMVIQIMHSDNADISPSHVGDIMVVEGTTIPTAYDASTTLLEGPITQGLLINHNYSGATTVGESQMLFNGEDGGGGYVEYMNNQWQPIPKRCKTRAIQAKPNTDYSIRLFNSPYNDIEFYVALLTEPGTITPTFTACSAYTQKAIPSNGPFITSEEQWIKLNYSHRRTTEYYPDLPCDVRPLLYKYCDHYTTLKAGTYKVMIDCWGNNRFWSTGGYWTGIHDYSGCVYDNANRDQYSTIYEWFSLLEEDDTVVIPKTKLLPDGITNKTASISSTPPLPNYFHKEVEFTLDHDTKVGLMHRAYYNSVSDANEAHFRFMIVDSDVEAEYFQTTGADPAQMQGYSAWEKYQVSLKVRVYNSASPDQSELAINTTIPLDDFLYEGDTVSLTSSSVDIETFEGWNRIEVLSDIEPTIYIKYQQ